MKNESQMDVPLVSILIPSYNHAKFLREALDSALAQTYPHTEIIVIDDGSTDNTRAVVEQYGQRVRYIWQKNSGLCAARNTGLRTCTGEYISLLDADDVLEPQYLTKLIDAMRVTPNANGIYCGYRFINQDGDLLPRTENRVVAAEHLYATLLNGNFLVPESVLAHRSCYEEAGYFDENLWACEDWDMWLRISASYLLNGIPDTLVQYRVVDGSMSTDPLRMLTNRLKVLKKHIGCEPIAQGTSTDTRRKVYAQAYVKAVIENLQSGNHQSAHEHLCRVAQLYPLSLTELSLFYELGCGDQLRGFRGDVTKLDLWRNSKILLQMLDRIFADSHISSELAKLRRTVYGTAYAALSMLHYNAGHSWQARQYASKAVITDIRIGLRPKIAPLLVRSALGAKTVRWLKQAITKPRFS